MEKMSKQKFIRLVMSAASEVVKTSNDKSVTIEAEVPSGTKTDQVSIVVRGRRGHYETMYDHSFFCFGQRREVRRYPEFISTQLTINGVKGEIAFWGTDIPPELRNLTARELSAKGYQIHAGCSANDKPFKDWTRPYITWRNELRDFLEEEIAKGGEVCGLNRDEQGNFKIDFYDGTSKVATPAEFAIMTDRVYMEKPHPFYWPLLRFLHPDRWATLIENCGRQYAYSHCR